MSTECHGHGAGLQLVRAEATVPTAANGVVQTGPRPEIFRLPPEPAGRPRFVSNTAREAPNLYPASRAARESEDGTQQRGPSRKASAAACGAVFCGGLIAAFLCHTPPAFAGGPEGNAAVGEMVERLSRRVDSLERENASLKSEISSLRNQVQATGPAVSSMQQQISQAMPKTEQRVADIEKRLAATDEYLSQHKTLGMPYDIGFRSGWSEVPFDLPGGFFFDAHLGHTLLTQEDGIPFGDIHGEIAIGLVEGNQAPMTVTTLAGIKPTPVNTKVSLSMVLIDPTVQYTLMRFEPFEPYILAGPELAINLAEARPLNAGQLPLPTQLRQRGLPTIGTAHCFAGGVFGFGWQYRLSDLASALDMPGLAPIFSKVSAGPEWRYHVMENGENFQTYSGSITIGF